MILGTIRPEEAKTSNAHAGYHQFHDEDGEKFGSFEVFWCDEATLYSGEPSDVTDKDHPDYIEAGWYWWPCFPGCLPDGDCLGPFSSSLDAMLDADEWHPDYLD